MVFLTGANMKCITNEGLTWFDFIHDFSDWMDTSLLPGDVIERLKGWLEIIYFDIISIVVLSSKHTL